MCHVFLIIVLLQSTDNNNYFYFLETHGSHLGLICLLAASCYPILSHHLLIFLHSYELCMS